MSDERTAYAVLDIDLDAVVGNWRALRDRLKPGTLCAGVVKADAEHDRDHRRGRVAGELEDPRCRDEQGADDVVQRRVIPGWDEAHGWSLQGTGVTGRP